MENHRVSISLVIDDDKLYHSFILPNKHQRTLNNIVVKCLTAYFYDENVRNMILGSMSNVSRDSSTDKSIQEKLAEIRGTLTMQDYYVQQMNDLVAEGQEVTEDVLQRANNRATQQGNFTNQKTSSGSQMLLPVDDTPKLLSDNEKEFITMNAKIDTLCNMISGMLQSNGIQVVPVVQQQMNTEQPNQVNVSTIAQGNISQEENIKTPVTIETSLDTVKETTESVKPTETVISEVEKPTVDNEFDGFAEDIPAPPPDISQPEPVEDSSDALAALLGSL